jgi:2'-hydroxyisoflavone reductase
MQVLVLGGTSFVGRGIVEDLLARGHTPVLFNRGRTGRELHPGVERLVGDRDTGDYDSLRHRAFDALIDVSAYLPRHIAQAAEALGEHRGRYLLISTGMVYDRLAATDVITEGSPLLPAHRASEVITDDTYGRLKVACEQDLVALFGDRATAVRPGWVVGPHDHSDQLTYWIRRAADATVAAPRRLDRPVQVIDVRDLARLVVLLVEQDRSGAYNAVGPATPLTFGELIRACGDAQVVPVDDDAVEFPLCLPDASWDVLFRISAAAARQVGMPQTPLAQTIADTRAWDVQRGRPALVTGPSESEGASLLS